MFHKSLPRLESQKRRELFNEIELNYIDTYQISIDYHIVQQVLKWKIDKSKDEITNETDHEYL